jgi:hypothetical protein
MLDGSWFFECRCGTDEHTVRFVFDDDDPPEVYLSIYLNQYRNIFKRIWVAVKYIFGYKCKYGHWDNWILDQNDANRMKGMLNQFIDAWDKWTEKKALLVKKNEINTE